MLAILVGINQAAAQSAVCASGTTLPGVDVSHYNGSITWSNVKAAGIVFSYAEATDGTTYTDPDFSANWPGMKAAGIFRGAYAVFEPNTDPTMQADYFITAMGTLQPGDLPPMLEVDVTDSQSAATIAAYLATWVNRVQAATGRVPIIYTAKGFWNGSVGQHEFFGLSAMDCRLAGLPVPIWRKAGQTGQFGNTRIPAPFRGSPARARWFWTNSMAQ